MPVTKTAKRALRSSAKKLSVNKRLEGKLEVSIKEARKSKSAEKIKRAMSLADRAAKKKTIHKNKASRIKSSLSKLLPKTSKKVSKPKKTKTSKQAKKA